MASAVMDFDVERRARERGTAKGKPFKLGGVTFHTRSRIHPEALAKMESITDDATIATTLDALDSVILAFIDPDKGAHDKYREVRANLDDPITIQDLLVVMEWLVEESSKRPTKRPSPSGSGHARRRTSTRSTGGSS